MSFHRDIVILFTLSLVFHACVALTMTGFNTTSIDAWRHLSSAENIYLGKGYVVDTVWPLNEGFASLPQKEFVSQPLYPMLVSLAFMLLGNSITGATIVNVIVESLNAALTCLLTFEFTKSRKYALIAGLLYSTNVYILESVVNFLTESLFTSFTLLVFILLLRKRSVRNSAFIGLCVGLAFLTRIQALILLLPVIFFLLKQQGRQAAKSVAAVIIVALIVSSPTLYRSWSERGSLFYTPSQYVVLIPYPAKYYQATVGTPSRDEILGRINTQSIGFWFRNISVMAKFLVLDLGSVFVFFLMLVGLTDWRRFKKEHQLLVKAGAVYFLITFSIIITSYMQERYLQFIIPFMTVLAGGGLRKSFDFAAISKSPLQYVIVAFMMVLTVSVEITEINSRGQNMAARGSIWLQGKTTPGDVVMGDWPYHADYLLKVKAVQLPSQKEYLKTMIDLYNVTYVVYMPAFDYNVITGGEDYLSVAYDDSRRGYIVYSVKR